VYAKKKKATATKKGLQGWTPLASLGENKKKNDHLIPGGGEGCSEKMKRGVRCPLESYCSARRRGEGREKLEKRTLSVGGLEKKKRSSG